jgi:hypothetical protein
MLKFTKPQLGDPKEHKSQIANQVRRHAAKVAAVRSKKGKLSAGTTADNSPGSTHETCFHIEMDTRTEELRKASTKTVQSGETTTSDGQIFYRPRWTAVYKLNRRTRSSNFVEERTSASTSGTTSQSQSPYTDSDLLDLDFSDIKGDLCSLPWDVPQSNTPEQYFDVPVDSLDTSLAWSFSAPRSLVAAGKHIPDMPATAFALELGSGFQQLDFLPSYLLEALQTAAGATVALDQVARGAAGAPLLEDIVDAAQSSQAILQNISVSSMATTTIEELLADCTSLTALVYGELVLYPSPQEDHILLGLLEELKGNLDIVDFWLSGEEDLGICSDLLLWATSLGAMAASSTLGEDTWFVQRLANSLYCCPKLQGWRGFVAVVSKFLWWRPVCNQMCKEIWKSAVRVVPKNIRQGSPL